MNRHRIKIFLSFILIIALAALNYGPRQPNHPNTYSVVHLATGDMADRVLANWPAVPEGLGQPPTVGKGPAPVAATKPAAAATPTTSPAPSKDQSTQPQVSRELEQQRRALYSDLNTYVLRAISAYQASGRSYPYLLNTDYANYNGVTADIYYQDTLLLKAHPSGSRASHCVGITFEVFFRAMQSRNLAIGLSANQFGSLTASELRDFVQIWYAAAGPKTVSNPGYAIHRYGLGQQITDWEQAKAGDFIDFSRDNGTGHSVILINWLREQGKIVGLRYWSSQGSSGGIGYRTEYFAPRGAVLPSEFFIGRVGPVADYR